MARITWLGHATTLVELGGTRLLTDPVLRDRVAHLTRIAGAAVAPEGVDAVLLSHLHRDHADRPTLRRLPGVPVLGAPGAARVLRGTGVGPVREMRPDDEASVGEIVVRATPAAHDGRRHAVGARVDALGFMIEGPLRIYFAGDTDLFDGMRELAASPIDVALLPVWGWGPRVGAGHLDPARAAEAVAMLRPRIAVPIHWGTYAPIAGATRRAPAPDEPARRFAGLVARDTPSCRVVVLEPGATLELAHP